MPKVTVNGKAVEVKEGASLIEAFKKADQDIAHYCWHPGLSVAGVCRLCMVEIDGQPRLQIACNTIAQEGMVANNQSEKVKDTVKWGLDFHLINHPLDCPICDQAGECELQNQYMAFGKYDSEMAERKVKKRKVVDLGERVVLDSERCILCSRCVRFTAEVTKTNELGIFNRGDRSEIGTFEDKPLNNNYSVNTVDICPVGALTYKDFRFRQRVWYLRDKPAICTGCSTGCNVDVYYNEEGLFRIKPRYNPDVNGYWMCDKGRDTYKWTNIDHRQLMCRVRGDGKWSVTVAIDGIKRVAEVFSKYKPGEVAAIVTGQFTNEEYESFFKFFVSDFGSKNVFHWLNQPGKVNEFDGLLFRGDRNPNTQGLVSVMKRFGLKSTVEEFEKSKSSFKAVIVLGPEAINPDCYPDFEQKVDMMSGIETVIWLTAVRSAHLDYLSNANVFLVPMKSNYEKSGSFTNHSGKVQKFERVTTLLPDSLSLDEVTVLLAGKSLDLKARPKKETQKMKENYFVHNKGAL